MNRRKFLQVMGAVMASPLINTALAQGTASPFINTALAQGTASPLSDLTARVLSTRPNALNGYWPLDESGGSVIHDVSPNGFNGIASNVVFGHDGPGDGKLALGFDPRQQSVVNLDNAGMAAKWNPNAGTFMYRAKINDPVQWDNNTIRRIIWAGADKTQHFSLRKQDSFYNCLRCGRETGGNGSYGESLVWMGMHTADWFVVFCTWDVANNISVAYLSLDQRTTYSKIVLTGGMESISMPLTYFRFGNSPQYPTQSWIGQIGRVGAWSAPLTEAEVTNLYPVI